MKHRNRLWLLTIFILCFSLTYILSNKYKKETIYVKNEEKIINNLHNDFLTLLPEADKIFEHAAIEKPYLIDRGFYGFRASNVTVSDYDCYIERAIEKGFKEAWCDDDGYLIWGGINKNEADIYKLSVIYDKKTEIISISIYKEDKSNDYKQCLPI